MQPPRHLGGSTGIRPEPYTEKELKSYIQHVEEVTTLEEEIKRIQLFLQKLHKPDFFTLYPNETPETKKQLIYKFTQVFQVLLVRREQERRKQEQAEGFVPIQIEY